MDDAHHGTTCQQAVSAEDSCCQEEVCGVPASWIHRVSGAALCAEHEANARKWSSGGTWRVGERDVSYPDGWERADRTTPDESPLLRVDTAPGLVIEREPLTH